MDLAAILAILKIDLQLSSAAYDAQLNGLIDVAISAIKDMGITLEVTDGLYSSADGNLIEMYAAYLFRDRFIKTGAYANTDTKVMPRYLKWMLNNRLFTEKAKDS